MVEQIFYILLLKQNIIIIIGISTVNFLTNEKFIQIKTIGLQIKLI